MATKLQKLARQWMVGNQISRRICLERGLVTLERQYQEYRRVKTFCEEYYKP